MATNDKEKDYNTALANLGFQCFSLGSWHLCPREDFLDNFLIYAVEMKIVDDAAVCIRTFNDSMPWYRASLGKPSHHLLDRSMHDYVFGFSASGSQFSWPEPPSTVGITASQADEVKHQGCSYCGYNAIVFEGQSCTGRWWELPASVWPMESCSGTCNVSMRLLEPALRNVPDVISVWTEYFGPLAAFTDAISEGLARRSTLYGFENVSAKHRKLKTAHVPRRGAIFCYVSMGRATVIDQDGSFVMIAGQYCAVLAPARFELDSSTRLVAVHTHPFLPLRAMGGPIETKGRLRYVDGCSDTLLLAPPKLSDPCLNLLHFPPGIHQTLHTHPSVRCGLIASGAGYCLDGTSRKLELEEGMIWAIPKDTVHSFHTAESKQELNVIAFHPDSDWGPVDEDHPMLNRTWVDGIKIDNRTVPHHRADMLHTDQTLVQRVSQMLSSATSDRQGPCSARRTASLEAVQVTWEEISQPVGLCAS